MDRLDVNLNKGIRRSPSYAQNGELAECVNLYCKNGELLNIPKKETLKEGSNVISLPSPTYVLLGIHQMEGRRIFISRYTNNGATRLYYTTYTGSTETTAEITGGPDVSTSVKIRCVGRILIAFDDTSQHYYQYKNGDYLYLADALPEISLDFKLDGEMICVHENWDYGYPPIYDGGYIRPMDENKATEFTDFFMGKITRFENEQAKAGRFTHTFFVRYAMKLYDGTYTHQSSPVLMTVTTREPLIDMTYYGDDPVYAHASLWMMTAKLKYSVMENISDMMDTWGDLIKGVDIFVSLPIRYQDTSKKFYDFTMDPDEAGHSILRQTNIHMTRVGVGFEKTHQKRQLAASMLLTYASATRQDLSLFAWVKTPLRSEADLKRDLENPGPFYLIKGLTMEDLAGDDFDIIPTSERLTNLAAQTTLEDDYYSHDTWLCQDVMLYNSRLHMTGVSITPSLKRPVSSFLQHTGAYDEIWVDTQAPGAVRHINVYMSTRAYKLRVLIERADGTGYVVDTDSIQYENLYLENNELRYFFYPDPDAKKAWIYRTAVDRTVGFELPLQLCDTLNGAFWCPGVEISDAPFAESTIQDMPAVTDSVAPPSTNKIYQSAAGNPFLLSALTAYTVGSGTILKLGTNTEPLSPGQYGQFPLIAFSTDGTWALDVKNDGTLTEPSPLSDDILTNLNSLTMVEKGLLFITSQGLKMLSINKEITLLTGLLEGKNVNEAIYSQLLPQDRAASWLPLMVSDTADIKEALQTCRMVYNSKYRLVHIFFSGSQKVLVLNLQNAEFSSQMESATLANVIEDYPSSLMQFTGSSDIYTYDYALSDSKTYGFCLSRILEIGDVTKMNNILQMKVHHDANTVSGGSLMKTALYVSDDKVNWALLTSLKGASYKYYRFALFTYLTDYEAVSGISMLYNEARSNKLR